jgi:DNA-binding transcriptional regulator YhcF (GntR family)
MFFGRGSEFLSGYNFTERARKVLAMTREEARRLRHEYMGTEHMLLAIMLERGCTGATVLQDLGVDLHRVRRRIEKVVKEGRAVPPPEAQLPYTSRAKKVLELAMVEARELNHSHVGTEHLVLGLLREERGIAAQVLTVAGVTLDAARAETLRRLNADGRGSFYVRIDDSSDRSIYEQIVAQVQESVATGRVVPGDRLPTVRQLADDLDIAPGTVARAYTELERLGVVVTEGVRGTRVAARKAPGIAAAERPETLVGLLRPVAVAAFHLGASADELRAALAAAMKDIFGTGERDAA